MARSETSPDGQFRAENLTVRYGSTTVIDGLDLAVPPGAVTALIGPNGSGKSTVLRTLARLIKPESGDIVLDGRPVTSLSARQFARCVGLLSQSPQAPEGLSVRDLVRQGRYPHRSLFGGWTSADEAACGEAVRLTAMEGFAARTLESLSGGQRQRAWISMVLAQETSILLLDEPTTYLDLSHQIEIMELLGRLVSERGKTVVAVLHDLNQAARYATHMVLLDEGRVAASGTPDMVVTAENIARVFGIDASVMPDPFTQTPMFIPLARQPARKVEAHGL